MSSAGMVLSGPDAKRPDRKRNNQLRGARPAYRSDGQKRRLHLSDERQQAKTEAQKRSRRHTGT